MSAVPRRAELALWVLPLAFMAQLFVTQAPSHAVLVLAGAALWWLGRTTFISTGILLPALLAQSAPFLSPITEPVPIIAMALLIAAVVPPVHPRQDWHAALAGMALALGVACDSHFAMLGVVPLLLLDQRRFLIYGGTTITALAAWFVWGTPTIGAPLPSSQGVPPLIAAAVFLASLVQMTAYVRMRRRGLVEQDKFARLLVGILAAQILAVLTQYPVPASLLTGPAITALWSLSRPTITARNHRRLWLGVALVVTVAAVAAPSPFALAKW
ncbi:MAG: hypothetical protein H7Y60_10265 [Rhodospirillaceae bacterium]|nr:hypothetical protein [Rhodospirillales bacterium]